MMILFDVSVDKHKLKHKATSNMKIQQVFSSLSLNDVGINLRNGSFELDIGTDSLPPFDGTHWVLFVKENNFDSYGCSPPQKLSKFNIKRYGL